MNRFKGIKVEEDETALIARNAEGRVLFRYNHWSMHYGIYRSSRMTDAEMDFIIIQLEQLFAGTNQDLEERKTNILKFLNYEIQNDIYCS